LVWATVPISGAPRLPMIDIIMASNVSVMRKLRVEGGVFVTVLLGIGVEAVSRFTTQAARGDHS
jgi:hypothetical protein